MAFFGLINPDYPHSPQSLLSLLGHIGYVAIDSSNQGASSTAYDGRNRGKEEPPWTYIRGPRYVSDYYQYECASEVAFKYNKSHLYKMQLRCPD